MSPEPWPCLPCGGRTEGLSELSLHPLPASGAQLSQEAKPVERPCFLPGNGGEAEVTQSFGTSSLLFIKNPTQSNHMTILISSHAYVLGHTWTSEKAGIPSLLFQRKPTVLSKQSVLVKASFLLWGSRREWRLNLSYARQGSTPELHYPVPVFSYSNQYHVIRPVKRREERNEGKGQRRAQNSSELHNFLLLRNI